MARKAAEKKKEELTLEDALMACRNALRGVGSTEKNRDAVISLVFLKFSGDKFEERRKEIQEEYGEVPAFLEKASFYNAKNVFYLPEEARWNYLVNHASDTDIALKIDTALKLSEEKNPSLKGALPQGFFATLGATASSVKSLIDNINKINPQRFQEEDLVGRVYEYFLQTFAAGATKEEGEFYTPACVVQLIAELIEPYEGVVFDPCCGSGGMFVQSHKFVQQHHGNRSAISVVGQESNPVTWRLCKMNLAIRGISNDLGEKAASSFTADQHKDRKVDYVMANPPFNLKDWRDENALLKDPRWEGYGAVPPKANANYAWILHIISKLDVNHGIAGFLLANGALGTDDANESAIRQKLLEKDKVEAIIVLPRDMFYTTDISVTLWIVNMNKKACRKGDRQLRDRTGEVLFMDLRTWNGNIETYKLDKKTRKKKTVLTAGQIAEVKRIYNAWQDVDGGYEDVPELCKSVRLASDDAEELTLAGKGYVLTPSKYIEFIDHDLDIDFDAEMARIQGEMQEVMAEEKASQKMVQDAFEGIGYGIA